MGGFDYQRLYLTADGRIGRQDYWMGVIGFIVIGIIFWLLIWLTVGVASYAAQWLAFLLQLILAYPNYNLSAKRFQDRDRPPVWALYFIAATIIYGLLGLLGVFTSSGFMAMIGNLLSVAILIVAVWFLIELGFLRGTVGPNQYGPDPLGG
jgi:uncharacterized membrane protein YhaH (DUF805 family)